MPKIAPERAKTNTLRRLEIWLAGGATSVESEAFDSLIFFVIASVSHSLG